MEDEGGGADEAEQAGERSFWRRDLAIVVGVVLVFVIAVWGVLQALPDGGPKPEAADLERFDEIDLGELAGSDALIGSTRSELLPMKVTRSGRGETSLAIVDAKAGTVTDAGPIPVDGWVLDAYPQASDRFVALLSEVCNDEPYEGDSVDECGRDQEGPIGRRLFVYDIEAERWSDLEIDDPGITLDDVDGSDAILRRTSYEVDDPDTFTAVDLTKPLAIGAFDADEPRPNGLVESQGHFDGWGWKARGASGWEADTTWTDEVGGSPATVTIANEGDRRYSASGSCLVITTYRRVHLDHLHRLCAEG